MAYLGNTPTQQGFTPAIDYFSGNASTTAFTLSRPVASVAQVQAVIENVPQNPGDAFTVSGNTITFTSAPPSGTNNIYVYYTSPITTVVQPGQGTVGTAQLVSGLTLTDPVYTGTLTGGTGVINIGSGQFYKDSLGNVGIGTSSPNINTNGTVLHINNSTASRAAMLHMTNGSSGSTATDGLIVGKWSDNDNYFWDYEAQAIVFGTNSTERMRIDTSGRVTTPYQPAFQAHVSSSGTLTTAGNDIIFGTAVTNIGSNYNTTNGRFTAPIAGNYFFTFSVLKGNTTGLEVRYLRNNTDYHDSLWAKDNTSVANNTISCSAVIAMSANDYVTVNVYYGTAYGDYTNFSGFLIG